MESITFSASSIEAWCRYSTFSDRVVGAVVLDGAGALSAAAVAAALLIAAEVEAGAGGGILDRTVSHFQFARPAVVLSLRDQISLTPPVEAARRAMAPAVIVSSSSARKAAARACLLLSNAFLAAVAARPAAGAVLDLVGEAERDFVGD